MQQHLPQFIKFITTNNLKALLQHYVDSSETENIEQLNFMFQQAEIKPANYDYYQQLATGFIEAKGLSQSLISQITSSNALSFYTPALQIKDNFKKIDNQQCNVLHYLFTSNKVASINNQPPFNYVRSMMLFGSNTALYKALCQRNKQNLTPIEVYLFTHNNLSPLASHELAALLALIEIESNQQTIDIANYFIFIQEFKSLYTDKIKLISKDLHRVILIATYYKKSIHEVITDIN